MKQRREAGKQREGRRGNCTNCNRQHPTGKCPAANSRCRTCCRHGHWEARQHAGANRQSMLPSQALRSPGDPAHNPGQVDEEINKLSTSCTSMKTAPMMTRSNTWNLTVSQTMTGVGVWQLYDASKREVSTQTRLSMEPHAYRMVCW